MIAELPLEYASAPEPGLHLGDCLPFLCGLPAESVDVVVTSPPYNLGIRCGAYDDTSPREQYLAWVSAWGWELRRVLARDGSFFLNVAGKPTDPLVPYQVLQVMLDLGWKLQNTIHWVKSMSYDLEAGEPCEGHVKPLTSDRFLNDAHEFVFHLTREGHTPVDKVAVGVRYADENNLKRGTRGKNGNARCAGNIWHLPYETIQRRETDRPHPATFPVSLADRCIRLHGIERARLVLDPFMGIGNTAAAAARLGVPCIGCEIDPDYWRVSRERLETLDE